jgi:hypothetical protein
MLKLICSIALFEYALAKESPPSGGKTFYKTLLPSDISGRRNVEIRLGSEQSAHGLWLSTLESNIGVGAMDCTRCNFTNNWNYTQSTTSTVLSTTESEEMYYILESDGEHNSLKDLILKGDLVQDTLLMCDNNDALNGMATIFAIQNPGGQIINSTLDGYLGLAPYTQEDATHYSHNFMYGLKSRGYIDHNVFSIYINTHTDQSSIKFGGWDSSAVIGKFMSI